MRGAEVVSQWRWCHCVAQLEQLLGREVRGLWQEADYLDGPGL